MTHASLIKKIEKLENEFKANDTKIHEIRTANNGHYSELWAMDED